MDWGFFFADILPLVLALLAGGIITGFLAGLLGIGGGGVMVPVLYELFTFIGIDPSIKTHLAVGTSLAVIIPTSLTSFRSHHARGAVDIEVLKSWGPGVFCGVLIGIISAKYFDGSVLRMVYSGVAFVLAMKIFFTPRELVFGTALPGQPVSGILGSLFGWLSTLMGVGGGIYISSTMTLYGRSIHQAVATSSGFGPIIAIPAALGYIWAGWGDAALPVGSLGYVSLIGAVLLAPMSVLTAPLGVRCSHSLSRRKLELAFGFFLLFMAIRFLISVL